MSSMQIESLFIRPNSFLHPSFLSSSPTRDGSRSLLALRHIGMTKYGAVSVDRLSTIMRTILRQLHKLGGFMLQPGVQNRGYSPLSIIPIAEDGPVALTNGLTVGGEWKVLKKLGEGGCGAVYMVGSICYPAYRNPTVPLNLPYLEPPTVIPPYFTG